MNKDTFVVEKFATITTGRTVLGLPSQQFCAYKNTITGGGGPAYLSTDSYRCYFHRYQPEDNGLWTWQSTKFDWVDSSAVNTGLDLNNLGEQWGVTAMAYF